MKLIFGGKKRGKLIVKLILLGGLVYALSILVGQRMLISNKRKNINDMKQKLSSEKIKVEEIKAEINAIDSSNKEYLESIAHKDLNLSKQGERVFLNIKGN